MGKTAGVGRKIEAYIDLALIMEEYARIDWKKLPRSDY